MSHRKAKTAPKIFLTDQAELQRLVLRAMSRVADAVGRTMGPGGRNTLIESDYPGIPSKNTKDGVTVFKSLGAVDAYEHLIIEQACDVSTRTATEAGDGTTTATVLSYNIIKNLFEFCKNNPKYSPQKAARRIQKVTDELLLPYVESRAIKVNEDNKELLRMVAKISANGDGDMADAVIQAFEEIGYGDASHVTIRELSGKKSYKVERIDGFPIAMGFEDSIGKLHVAFINDQANQRCYMEKPLFVLYDGNLTDMVTISPLLAGIGQRFMNGETEFKNIVIFAHGYSENVLTALAYNFADPNTMNIIPMVTPMQQFINSQTHFLQDLAAFTGATVFGLKNHLSKAQPSDLGKGMESFEASRFRSTVVGEPDPTNVEVRADDLKVQMTHAESQAEKLSLEERIGKITNGIAKLTIYGGSNGELKEAHDRCEDAVCAVRAAISGGAVPGGCRMSIDMASQLMLTLEEGDPAREVLVPSLLALPEKLLDNAGNNKADIEVVMNKLIHDDSLCYDVENDKYGKAEDLGLFDATRAVSQSLSNAVSIACVLGTMGGIVCHPRDEHFERNEARLDSEFSRAAENPNQFVNEANERP
jgi:chaperonin GroEL